MLVLHLIKATGIAGAERHLLTLLPELRTSGVDARLCVLTEPDRLVPEIEQAARDAGIPFERVVIRSNADFALIGRLIKLFRTHKPDIVHTHLLHADLFGIPAARLAGVKRVITSRHNDDVFRQSIHWRAIHWLQWRMLDAGIAISDAIRQFCIAVEGAPARKVHTIHYGLASDLSPNPSPNLERGANTFPPSEIVGAAYMPPVDQTTLKIGMICRLIPQKGVEYGIEAFARLAPDYRDARLIIAGDGDSRTELEALVRRRNVQDRVEFLGWQSDVAPIMSGLDVFLMPSLWEGFGLVLLEAMSHHLPIIASRVSAIPEIVLDGETGILVTPRDVDGLQAALRRLLDEPTLRTRMGDAGAVRLRDHFSEAQMIDATYTLYQKLF